MTIMPPKIIFLTSEDWAFCTHRLPVARAARDAGYQVIVVTNVDQHQDQIEQEGFRLIPLQWDRGNTNPLQELKVLRQIIQIYRQEAPDLLHHVALKPVLLGSLASWFAKRPAMVNALTGLGYLFIKTGRKAHIIRQILCKILRLTINRQNACLLMQNPDDLALLQNLGVVTSAKTALIRGSGVDINQYHPTEEPSGSQIQFGLVARMLWDKGIGEAVGAADLLHKRGIDFCLNLIGPLDPHNKAAISAAQLKLWQEKPYIKWHGPIDDISSVWQQNHIALLPSYREGLPKALLEAAASGRAIIATDVPGCREICHHSFNGHLIAAKQIPELAEAMYQLATSPSLRQRYHQASRKLVETELSEQIVQQKTLAVYQDLTS